MSDWLIGVLAPALLALAAVLASALRRPILRRMAARNLRRRKAQALAIALGLMVGTALISGALSTGDSMGAAIRQTSLHAFGELDESVGLEGRLYFPADVAEALDRDPRVRAATEALAPLIIEDVTVAAPASRQSEPRAALVGIDPARDGGFGAYATTAGPRSAADLGPGEAIINQRLAESIQASAGDAITVRYAQRPDPLLPRFYVFNGSLTAGAGSPLPLPIPGLPPPYATSPLDEAAFDVPVDEGAVRLTAVLFWGSPGNVSDLDVLLVAPDGTFEANGNGTLGQPDAPAVVNASALTGTWTARVASKAAADQRFTLLVLVFYPVTDLAQVEAFVEQLGARPEAEGFVRSLTGDVRLEARNFTVKFVALEEGRGGFLNAKDVFVRLEVAQAMFGKPGRANLLMVSNPGDEESGLAGTAPAMAALDAALADLRAQRDEPEVQGLRARPLKQEFVQEADRAGGLFSSFLTTMSSFSILAGLILIVNIFVMLTEERRAELGIARAVGMTRGDLTRLFVYEGAAYAALASMLGAFAGLGVSLFLIAALNFSLGEQILIRIPFRPTPDALLIAFGAGVLMTLAAVALASQRAARLNIVRSIRRLEEPDTPLGRGALWAGLALLLLGAPASLLSLATGSFTGLVLAPNLVILGAALLVARVLHRSDAMKLAGVALFLYNVFTVYTLETPATLEATVVSPFRGVLLVVGAVLVLVNSPGVLRWTTRLLARSAALRPIARTALAYPLHKKLRTALTIVMFGLVLTVVVLFSVLFAIFTPSLAEQSGGFDVRADSTLPAQDLAQRLEAAAGAEPALRDVEDVASLEYAEVVGGRLITVDGERVRYNGPPIDYVYGFDAAFAEAQDFPLLELDPRFATPRDAYLAALQDPALIIVSRTYTNGPDGRPGVHHVGDTLTMRSRGGNLTFTIVAIQQQLYFDGVFVSKAVLEANFEALHGLHLMHVRDGADPVAVARAVEATQADLGVDAASIAQEAEQFLQGQRQLYALFQVYLGLGLVLGIASLGIITARSVLERRQEVGMLRAIGLPRAMVFRSFLVEGLFVVTIGAIIGVGIGIIVAYGAFLKSLAVLGLTFTIPWLDLAIIVAVAYACTLLAVIGPARRAARLQPAEAIRYIE